MIGIIGINYKTAALKEREKFSFHPGESLRGGETGTRSNSHQSGGVLYRFYSCPTGS